MALVTIRRSPSVQTHRKTDENECSSDSEDVGGRVSKSLNECYFASKGAAAARERGRAERERTTRALPQPVIQHHLQSMFELLSVEETLKMAVKLESAHAGRTRYLVVVSRGHEAALLGIDCNHVTTVGLVLRVLADTSIKLDGDGGFSVCVCSQQHIFKPVSVQAMWSALQTLHRVSARAREFNHFAGGASHGWVSYYERRVASDRSCLNEWHAMDCLESRRPPSPDSLRLKPCRRDETERVIRSTLKEIMMSVDLDEVTSKAIRGRLEDELDMDLAEYKSFIDQEMITILGQMDSPTEVFGHVYLGSEWNASNLEELQRNGVRHILNVTREIDNFFPGMFDYLNIRVYDDDKTDLLKHWDNTFKYIDKAKSEGSKVLVHCKMGISRSASVVIAYAMKAYNWNFDRALEHVKTKRSCIKPNTNFMSQLETYQGILDAMKNKEKLQRSKSETNLKSGGRSCRARAATAARAAARAPRRPRSWSPDSCLARLRPPASLSLETLVRETRHRLMPCAGGCYSVSPNQIIRLKQERAPSVRLIVHEIESARRRPPAPPALPAPAARDCSDSLVNCDNEDATAKVDPVTSVEERAVGSGVRARGCALRRHAATWSGRLSASAPADTWLRAGPRRRRLAAASHPDLTHAPGLVSNLKKEFEARSGPAAAGLAAEQRARVRDASPPEDLSVRDLVHRYDGRQQRALSDSGAEAARELAGGKKSRLERRAPPLPAAAERPPPAPTVVSINYPTAVLNTVVSKAQNKKQLQHGKTHPLTRLNMNRASNRCSNPVYNTM